MTEPWLPIRTPRLILREFRETDHDDIHAYGSDPNVARFMDWGPNTPDDTREAVARMLADQSASPRDDVGLAIEHVGAGRVIGSIALHWRDRPNRTAELGYCLHRDFWGQGVVTEAARALLEAGFRHLDLHRVFATCDVRNTGSFGVMEKIGMRREGCLRRDRQVKGAWRDTYLYALLAEEFLPKSGSPAVRSA